MPKIDQVCIEWLRPAETPLLEHGGLHLWRVDLKKLGQTADLEQILSLDEKARYHRLLSHEKRTFYLAGRAALRTILAKYLHLLPKAIRFEYNENGKPFLVNPKCVLDVRFNLSHSSRWMVLGVSKGADLGVDIEEIRPVQKTWALEQLFTGEERDGLAGMPEDEKNRAFIAAWTEKEAAAKANGVGLSGSLTNQKSRKIAIKEPTKNGYTLSRKDPLWFIHFEPAPGYLGCAAFHSESKPCVEFYEFSVGNQFKKFPIKEQPLIDGEG